ncbi:pyridoxamine 5'-phosphate oxidase [Exophiala spinifera]|uniref:pyridoxal 5'-phosphate synthase n=1 Tax=Exophiala spinifera TaxID=91928 RepID=A0A0D2B1Q3_9EURO|nr:pyridoxamine 5'-phosphate oxidase [Exophiala spinifera]KIW12863.1 pyridoxamine 5'-phosphate oxidase [Exophiala spinifera]
MATKADAGESRPPQNHNKLIFAPGEAPALPDPGSTSTPAPSQAAQFSLSRLHRSDLSSDPFLQFHSWFTHAQLRGSVPETVTLSTASLPSGRVSSRVVYLKELDERGFVIYSNFGTSRKAADLATNPHASLCFWWKPLERQVRVEGVCERLTPEESQVYFDTRARGSRIGAWASQQTSVLKPLPSRREGEQNDDDDDNDGRLELENRVEEVSRRFEGQEQIPVPPFWGGLRIIPDVIEFWQGRESRLHDRFVYTRQARDGGEWKIERLSP